ncbi:MAG: general secretion pathway protein GspK [Lentisphaeria bacterium]|nr:general secretion pathway protein GspK [Lentisphaeria bacterium]
MMMKRSVAKRILRRGESGIALISVLLLIATGSLLALMVMSISKTTSFTVMPFIQLQRSYYVLEGMAARIQFLISADRELYGNPQQLNVDNYSEYDTDRYLPDAVPHYMDYYGTPIVFTIKDAAGPVNLQGTNFQQALQQFRNFVDEDNDFTDLLELLNYLIADYIDTDDSPTDTDSWEAEEYEEYGMAPLPRNGAITDRNEFAFIPGITDLFPIDQDGRMSYIRLIPPANAGVTIDGNPDIFSVTDEWLYDACDLDESDLIDLKQAIADFHSFDRVPLSESLPSDSTVMTKINNYVRWSSSGVYTVIIRPAVTDEYGEELEKKVPGRRLVFTYTPSPVTGATNGFVQFYEWMFF